jgi:hypothetical protein
MQTWTTAPRKFADMDEDRLPAGGGLMIALGMSVAFWGVLAWAVL